MKELCVSCFRNLSVGTRYKIYEFLKSNKSACVSEVTEYIKLKQPTVTYHLKEMEDSGLLKRMIVGNRMFFSINHKCPHDNQKCLVTKN